MLVQNLQGGQSLDSNDSFSCDVLTARNVFLRTGQSIVHPVVRNLPDFFDHRLNLPRFRNPLASIRNQKRVWPWSL